jgi:hypothetical protein
MLASSARSQSSGASSTHGMYITQESFRGYKQQEENTTQ